MAIYTTEIASTQIASDNPIHQRLLKAYTLVKDVIYGDLLDLGCGEGRGIDVLKSKTSSYTALDKIKSVIEKLKNEHTNVTFVHDNIPPLSKLASNSYDTVISFQVIEHIKNDHLFLKEIKRVLKPGGTAYLTTPNIKMSLTRNPWHIREYTANELKALATKIHDKVEIKGIIGNKKVMDYYYKNKKSVEKITKFDIFNLQYRLPRSLLRIPYEILNRINRNRLRSTNTDLVDKIDQNDFSLTTNADEGLDLFLTLHKHS